MGKALWESHRNGNWLENREWEWEGMGIDCTGMGGSGNVKSYSRASLVHNFNFRLIILPESEILLDEKALRMISNGNQSATRPINLI